MTNIAIVESTDYPQDLCCPISHELMIDPVIIDDGHTYERNNILKWFITSNKSPLTNKYLNKRYVINNLTVKKIINKWKEDNLIKREFYLDNLNLKYKDNDEIITCDDIKLNHSNFTYQGSVLNGEFSGKGILKEDNENIYDGEFLNNKKHGKGKMIFKNGDIYEGNWVQDYKEGEGTMKYKDGSIYKGEWSEDFRNGKGKITYSNKHTHYYDGYWKNDKRHGNGIFYNYGEEYDGEWSEDLKHGEGYLKSNGNKYYGKWINNEKQGFFIIKYSNGDKYNGEVNSYGERHGKGKLEYSEYRENNSFEKKYDYYEGQWENNIKEGKGFMKFKNGDEYIGEWSNNLRNGQGELKKYGKHDYYVGEWSEGWKKSSGIMKPYTDFRGTFDGSL